MTTSNDTAIHTRALLVWLKISGWSARKYDRSVSNKVNAQHGASSDASRVNKLLLPGDCASYKALATLATLIRSEHYDLTLPWTDEGWRLLPTANYIDYTDWLRKRQADFQTALDTFVQDYPALRMHASQSLGSLYRSDDYPDVSDIGQKFSVGLNYMPVPSDDDIRVNLAADQIDAIRADINAQSNACMETAMRDAWRRLHEAVQHANDKLADPSAIFRDSLIGNVQEICKVLKRLNVTDDPDLESMRAAVESDLSRMSPDILRTDKLARQTTADKAKAILDKMATFYTPAA